METKWSRKRNEPTEAAVPIHFKANSAIACWSRFGSVPLCSRRHTAPPVPGHFGSGGQPSESLFPAQPGTVSLALSDRKRFVASGRRAAKPRRRIPWSRGNGDDAGASQGETSCLLRGASGGGPG